MQLALEITYWSLAAVVVVATILSLVPVAHGFVRGADFPRQQVLLLATLLIVAAMFVPLAGGFAGALALAICAVVQLFYIGRYLPIWHTQSLRPRKHETVPEQHTMSLIAANVKKSNRDYHLLIDLVRKVRPDILMALEVDSDWVAALDALDQDYPHKAARPQENGYGMAVYSRYPLNDLAFRDLVVDKVPSLRARIDLGDLAFRLYVVHPEPPVPHATTEGRDAEMSAVALEARDDPLPVIVSGDLNDVAWSDTTRRFQRISGLLDPRIGRGFFNTFSATMPWMRWPLDHLFHSAHFRLIDMQRMPKIGSDHFPMYFKLLLTSAEAANSRPGDIEKQEAGEVKAMIKREQKSDRQAIGSDWEDDD